MKLKNENLGPKRNLVLIFFPGCPTFPQVKEALENLGETYELVNQDLIGPDSEFLGYSSPTVLHAGRVIFGSRTNENARGCTFNPLSADEILERLKFEIRKPSKKASD